MINQYYDVISFIVYFEIKRSFLSKKFSATGIEINYQKLVFTQTRYLIILMLTFRLETLIHKTSYIYNIKMNLKFMFRDNMTSAQKKIP